ncbi:PCYCGC domain-containing protein [Lysinibacillus piscis]|uniref:Lipoprotein n=1 Tax=Lysinibacillus piscis TaxID=2518931 RepID=A0ABQ5NKK3_9BACI|nr:PCYCGC domain-containing protein [Lysinibacillus sp. KH24]GLC88611.1 hypothetical protein LYSBPC_17380 [Lysinibacillus sp. KH24]
MKKLMMLMTFVLILSACSSEKEASHDEHAHVTGDIQEETASADVLPSFLNNQPENVRFVYQVAGQSTDILQWIPCYCGCGESAGHKNNLNCFIQEKRKDGTIVWDDHGTRCLTCLEIAVQSAKMYQDGKSLKEIRTTIDNTYKEGYAKPTPTDMPA